MSEEAGGGESDVKTVEEILKSEGNAELKFGLLIGLIKVNQVSSKDVVNTVLHLLVGGEFEIETNFVIQDAQNVLQMLKVLEQSPESLQAEVWSVFIAMLKKSRRNLQACTEIGLISLVMEMLLTAQEVVADLLVDMLGALAAYSITVKELRMLFRYLKADDGVWPPHSVKLISVLKQMPQRLGPDEFFSFPGKKGSCIHLPPVKTWPYQNGWTFSCWLRLDPVTGVTVERERPYLFCFHTNKGVGYSANFLGNSLVITSMKVKGKGFQHCVKYDFQPRTWYMVSIVHVYNRWSKSEIRCYVNGQLASGCDMSWLVSTYDAFDKCYIGGSSEGDVDHMFSGQLSAIYLFSEALSPQQISSIHELGPSYKSQFRFQNESHVRLTETAQRLLYDGKLTSILVFMYTPIACDGQLCLESSPKGNFNHFLHSPHAMMSGEVKSVITHSIHSTLHSLGGVQILFPLFGQLDLPVSQGDEKKPATDHSTCANLLGLLYNLIESSSTIHQQMVQNKGFLVIGHLLEKSSRDHVTPAVLEVFLKLTDYLVKCPAGGTLLKHLFDHILFNPAIWIHSCMEVQTKLYCYLATDFINDAQIYTNIRRVSAVLQTMHTLKYYYWVINPKDRSGITPKAVDGPRPDYDEIIKLRSFMLLYIKQLLLKGQGVQEDELQSMLNYLCTLHEDDNLVDVLELLVTLMSEHPQSMVPAFDKKQGIRTVFKLLASPNEHIRIKTLKLFGFWLSRSTPKRKQDSLSPNNLFSLLGERLLLNDQHITMATYNALFEMLTERMSLESHKARHEEPESHFRIENSALLKVVATMIRQSKPEPEIMEVKRTFLSDLTILCKNNKENRRTVLQMSVWQDWLFSMAYVYPQSQEQHKITEMVMSLFRMLLHHAIKFEYGGWRVWIDTLAILHSKVSYEDFKRHMATMYKQYDRQRVDDYAGQDERNRHPISTISGVSDAELNKPLPKSTVKVTEIEDEAAVKSLDNGSEAGASSSTDQSAESKVMNGDSEQKSAPNGPSDQPSSSSYQRDQQKIPTRSDSTRSGHRMFKSGPRAPPFRIPEFRWSYLHQQLLKDLLFSIETDVQVWKSHTTKTVIDFVNSGENNIYVVNVTHMISQLADNLITSCGGLLPLLAAATSSNGEVEILEPTQGLSIEQAVSILLRIMNLTDILVFASATNFVELEQEKNMPAGGILRQCLRLVCTAAVRNSLEVRHRQVPPTPPTPTSTTHPLAGYHGKDGGPNGTTDPIQALIEGSHPTQKNIVENLNEQISPIKDFEKLLQDMDINRLRAVVYRDVEETKQAQFLALAIVYFTSVLMVSKYRDILEPPSPAVTPNQSSRNSNHTPSGENQSVEDEEIESETQSGADNVDNCVDDSQVKLTIPVDVHTTQAEIEKVSTERPDTEGGEEDAVQTAKTDANDKDGDVDGDNDDKDDDNKEKEADDGAKETNGETPEETNDEDVEKKDGEADEQTGDKSDTADKTDDDKSTEQNSDDKDDESKDDLEDKGEDDAQDKESETKEKVEESEKPETVEDTDEQESDKTEENGPEKTEATKDDDDGDSAKKDDKIEEKEPSKKDETVEEKKADEKPTDGDKLETTDTEEAVDATGKVGDATEGAGDGNEQILAVHVDDAENQIMPISSISGGTRKPSESGDHDNRKPEKLELKNTPIPAPVNLSMLDSGNLTERLEKALGSVAPLLREIFVDFAPYLSKTLIGSHGQELLIGGLVTLKQSTSVVELVMLLCSQEWQNSLQKHAGLAFIELVNEGRLLAHATRDHIVRVANEADFILNRMRAEDVQKHAEFESLCAQMMLDRREEEKLCDHLITSAKRRDYSVAMKLKDKVLNILANKHGAWGEPDKEVQEFWKLDVWEDDSRRRRRFTKNLIGSTHPEAALKAALEHGATEDAINQAREAFHEHLASKKAQSLQPDYTDEELLMEDTEFDKEYSGPVAMSTTCKLIAPGVAINGLMSITKTDLYYEMDEDDAENKTIDPQVLAYIDYLHGKWNFNEIRAIFARRYLLQSVAIEIFLANRTAIMFAFPDHATVKKVINALPRVGVGVKYGLGQSRRMSSASGKQLYKMSTMTQKWQRREISNFDYLMYLNTIAGRTYNDLNQYPVFPWVIVNYDTDELDLSQPNNFRDLSKPIGALNPSRKEFFEERYNSWEHDQIPPFHYGTHYSTAAFTLNWLIRVEPFTTMFLNLQGGKFDHADRTFHSITQAWKNCQRDTSDVKELIPEFFSLPEMFVNSNNFNFGKLDEGDKVTDVVLPKWAKSPEDFVRINRMALESEFVSCQLHHWIDLIFGYKQRGPEAIRATNVFYYLTYEGSVNLETMTDHVMKEAIENQIRSFGQTPTQLLTEPHPPRSSVMHLSPMMFTSVQDDVCMIMKFLSNSPVCHVSANTHPAVPVPAVTAITCNHHFSINKWNTNYQHQGTPTSLGSTPENKDTKDTQPNLPLAMDQLLVMNTGLQRRSLGDNFDQRLKVSHSHFVTTADNRFIFACGFWDKSFRLYQSDSAKILQVVYGHFDVVSVITRSECNLNQDCYIVTGSKDCTVMVWMFTSRNQAIIGDNGSIEYPTPKATLTGHKSEVSSVCVLAELGMVISGSHDGPCLVHTLNGDLLRSLDPPGGQPLTANLICMSRETFVMIKFNSGLVCNFSVNGKLQKHIKHKDNIQAMTLSRDGQYLMLGGDNGIVEVYRSHDLTLLYSYPACDSNICSLALSHDHKFLLAGLATGCLLVFNIDFNKWHHEYQEKY